MYQWWINVIYTDPVWMYRFVCNQKKLIQILNSSSSFFLSKKKVKNFIFLVPNFSGLKNSPNFRLFLPWWQKHPTTSTLFICKNTDANRLPIFVLIFRFKCDFTKKNCLPKCPLYRFFWWIDTIDRVCTDGLMAISQTRFNDRWLILSIKNKKNL